MDSSELESILERARTALSDTEYDKLHAAMEMLIYLTQELEKKRVSVQRLKQLLFGTTTEKTQKVMEKILDEADKESNSGDDTTMKVLALTGSSGASSRPDPTVASDRTGVFTSGIVSVLEDLRIALFFTGHHHAGENLVAVLKQRACELGPPIQMCDALSRNMPEELETILGNCLSHGRRRFVEVAMNFPRQCLHALELLRHASKDRCLLKKF